MSTGSRTQAAFIQGNQSSSDQDSSHSALLYLFQEVSRLASPIHNKGGSSMVKEDGDIQSFSISNSSCQHSLSCFSEYNQIEKVKQESHSSKDTTFVNLHPQSNSPWKVLSLINLQCEMLLNPSDIEESGQSSVLSVTKFGNSTENALIKTEQGINFLKEMHKISAVVSSGTNVSRVCCREADKPQCCVRKESQIGVKSQTAENTLTLELVEDEVLASSQPQPKDIAEEKFSQSRQFSLKQECDNSLFSTGNIFNVLVPGNASFSNLSFKSAEEISEVLPEPALTLDHNNNITFTPEPQSDKQLPPLSDVLFASQSLSFDTAENDHSLSQQDIKLPASTPGCSNAPSEDKSLNASSDSGDSDSGETNLLDSAKTDTESRSVNQKEVAPSSEQTWRTKTPRKQRHPSKSVDIQDPDFQGVTFRMDTELDDSKEQCRLLITSKYSRDLRKSVRRPRLRTRAALKSLKMISSEEESDPATTAFNGKVCASCSTRKTPMWRDAEDGTPLCNACGIRFKKYRVRCVNCWHIPRKESNSNSCCLKCGNSLKLTSAHRKHTA